MENINTSKNIQFEELSKFKYQDLSVRKQNNIITWLEKHNIKK